LVEMTRAKIGLTCVDMIIPPFSTDQFSTGASQ
jgi:hypothetical protein